MANRLIGSTTENSIELSQADLGPPGSHGVLVIRPIFRGRSGEGWDTDRERRTFALSAILAKTPLSSQDLNMTHSAADGGSFFIAPENAAHIEMGMEDVHFRISLNEQRELSLVEAEIQARVWREASDRFASRLSKILNHLSYEFNVPVTLNKILTKDNRYEVQYLEHFSPYFPVQLPRDFGNAVQSEMDPLYALYREAINSDSPHYKMLCLYKIMEGVFRTLRPNLRRMARENKVALSNPSETVPADESFPDSLKPWIGKSITDFHGKMLTRQFRDAVAHFMLRDTTLLDLGSPEQNRAFAGVVRACDVCARVVLKNHEAGLIELQRLVASPAN